LINYPLMIMKYGMWRQVGLQTTTTTSNVDFNIGLFNGYPSNNWSDNNDGKDLFFRITGKPGKSFFIFGNAWLGNAVLAESDDLSKNLYGGGILYEKSLSGNNMTINFRGEVLLGREETAAAENINSLGYYVNAGLKINPKVEFLIRYDRFDPNTKTSANGLKWITAGVNYYLEGQNVMFYLNYIRKINEVAAGFHDPKDDELVFQAQVFF